MRKNKASLFEHLKRSFDHVVNNLGPHRLPLIGRADWNDCLNLNCFSNNPDESFQTTENKSGGVAESSIHCRYVCEVRKGICRDMPVAQKTDEAALAEKQVSTMTAAVNEHGWDGKWFLRAYDFFWQKSGKQT